MDEQLLARYGQRLLHAGVAPEVVRRYLKELDAHYRDLLTQARFQGLVETEAQAWAGQRLGSEEQLLAAMQRPELRRWSHRHPWLSVLLLPCLIYIAFLVGAGLCAMGLVEYFRPADVPITRDMMPPWLPVWIDVLIVFLMYGLVPLLGGAVVVWARRHYLRLPHQLAGLLLICVVGSALTIQLSWPSADLQQQGNASVRFGYAWDEEAGRDAAFHRGKKLRLAGNVLLCGGLIWLLRRRELELPEIYGKGQ